MLGGEGKLRRSVENLAWSMNEMSFVLRSSADMFSKDTTLWNLFRDYGFSSMLSSVKLL